MSSNFFDSMALIAHVLPNFDINADMMIVTTMPVIRAAVKGAIHTLVSPPEEGDMVDMDDGKADGC